MTMQNMERFEYQGELYDVAAIEGFDAFHLPAVLRSIPFQEPGSNLHRGFITTFSLNERQWLVVRNFHAWADSDFRPPVINGVIPCAEGFLSDAATHLPAGRLGDAITAVEMPDPDPLEEPDFIFDWDNDDDSSQFGSLGGEDDPSEANLGFGSLDGENDLFGAGLEFGALDGEDDPSGANLEFGPLNGESDPSETGVPTEDVPYPENGLFWNSIQEFYYQGIDVPMCYTGRMLIGKGDMSIDLGFDYGGYSSPLTYETVLELTFSDGVLQKVTDVSFETKQLRESLRSKLDRENDREHHVYSHPVGNHFLYDLEYEYKWTDSTVVFTCPVKLHIFLIDASGCSAEELRALHGLFSYYESSLEDEGGAQAVAVMEIGEVCRWITDSEDLWFYYWYLHQVRISQNGAPNYAKAFDLLDRSLSKHHLMRLYDEYRSWDTPVITLVSSGKNPGSWAESLKKLENNVWFQQSNRLSFSLSKDDPAEETLALLEAFRGEKLPEDSLLSYNFLFSEYMWHPFFEMVSLLMRFDSEIDYPALLPQDKSLESIPIRPEEQLKMDGSAPSKESLPDLNQDFSGWEADGTLTNESVLPNNRFLFYFVLDQSEQMSGDAGISAAEAIRNSLRILAETDMEDPLMSIWIGMLEIKSGPAWSSISADHTESIKDFIWVEPLPEGNASIGAALLELDQALSRIQKEDLPSLADGWNPIIVFITASHSADDWETAFNRTLANNELYRRAVKIAIGLEGSDPEMLKAIMFDEKKQNSEGLPEPYPGKVLLTDSPLQITGLLIEHVFNKFRASAGLSPISTEEKTTEELISSIEAKMHLLLGEHFLNDDPTSDEDGFGMLF